MCIRDSAKPDKSDIIDSDEEIEGNNPSLEKEKIDNACPFLTALHKVNGSTVDQWRPGQVGHWGTCPTENQLIRGRQKTGGRQNDQSTFFLA